MTNAELRYWYRRYNKKYFGGKLDARVCFSKEVCKKFIGHADWYDRVITISKEIKRLDCVIKGTLLHEMAHIKLPVKVNHGPRFEKEMLRLAKAGAFRGVW